MGLHVSSPNNQIKTTVITHTAAVTALTFVAIGGATLLAVNTVAADELNAYIYESELRGPFAGAAVYTFASTAYWDAANKEFTDVAAGNTKIGRMIGQDDNGELRVAFDSFNMPA